MKLPSNSKWPLVSRRKVKELKVGTLFASHLILQISESVHGQELIVATESQYFAFKMPLQCKRIVIYLQSFLSLKHLTLSDCKLIQSLDLNGSECFKYPFHMPGLFRKVG